MGSLSWWRDSGTGRGGCQFGIGIGIESHHHFGAVRRIGVVECDCGCPFLESERLRLSRRGLLCRLLRLGLLGFTHHCEEISLSHQLLLLVKSLVDCLQVVGFGVLACLGKRVHGLLMSLGGDMLLRLLEIFLILLALLPVLFGFFRLGLLRALAR